jgi:hypothetical protein
MEAMSRRSFLERAGLLGGTAVGGAVVAALAGADAPAEAGERHGGGYGPLAPVAPINDQDGFEILACREASGTPSSARSAIRWCSIPARRTRTPTTAWRRSISDAASYG